MTMQERKELHKVSLVKEVDRLARDVGLPGVFGGLVDWRAVAEDRRERFRLEQAIGVQVSKLNEVKDRIALIAEMNEHCGLTLSMLYEDLLSAQVSDEVRIDYLPEGRHPCHYLDSYRPNHRHAALGHRAEPILAGAFAEMISRSMKSGWVHGYKGGDYRLYPETPIWAVSWGESARRAIVGVRKEDGLVVLETEIVQPDN